MKTYLLLAISILLEVTGATFMKYSSGFTEYRYTLIVVLCYVLAISLYIIITRDNEIGIINALWSGGGTTLVALLAFLLFDESMTLSKFTGLLMILTGILGLTLPSSESKERFE